MRAAFQLFEYILQGLVRIQFHTAIGDRSFARRLAPLRRFQSF
jgi:hypothetical protein